MKRMEQLERRERELLKISFTNERKLTAEEALELEEFSQIQKVARTTLYPMTSKKGGK